MSANLDPERCARYLKALADPARLRIVQCLQHGPQSVSDIAEAIQTDIASASHHLRVLFNAGLVVTERDGRFIHYSLDPAICDLPTGQTPGVLDFGCCSLQFGDSRAHVHSIELPSATEDRAGNDPAHATAHSASHETD